jgi:Zn-dependent protease with chaperone function
VDFFEAQDRARRSSRTLTLLFILAVIAVVALTTLGLALALMATEQGAWLSSSLRHPPSQAFWHQPEFYLITAAAMTALILGGSLYKWISLQAGGAEVARQLGGIPVLSSTTDPQERRLLNVVEEMAIAAGIPLPHVYVLDDEKSINAFAAGLSPTAATIGITRGALGALTRDELQGVIAHEFSHILNGDMRLNLKLVAFLHGLLIIALIGSSCLRLASSSRRRFRVGVRSSNDKSVFPVLLVGITLWLIGYAGVLCGRLLKAAISREREFLADAAAVEFTRNPGGIAGALKKVARAGPRKHLSHTHAEEFTHMLFSGATSRWFTQLFSTHPPLTERIGRLLPAEPVLSEHRSSAGSEPRGARVADRSGEFAALGFHSGDVHGSGARQPTTESTDPLRPSVEQLGTMPIALREAVRQAPQAAEIVFQLIRGSPMPEQPTAKLQGDDEGFVDPESVVRAWLLQRTVTIPQRVHESFEAKVYLVLRAVPALRELHGPQRSAFIEALRAAIEADQQLTIFELGVFALLARSLCVPVSGEVEFDHTTAAEMVLGCLARLGETSKDGATRAFNTAWQQLHQHTDAFPHAPRQLPERSALTLGRLAGALGSLASMEADERAAFMHAAHALISADSHIKAREHQFFRILGAVLDVPVSALPHTPTRESVAAAKVDFSTLARLKS